MPGLTPRLSSYVTVLVEEWLTTFLVCLALWRRRLAMNSLVMGGQKNITSLNTDVGIAFGFLVIVIPLGSGLAHLLGANDNPALATITPTTRSELIVSLILAASAGFCEERVFRGYLACRFRAWTGSASLGILLQGLPFGLAHGFYGRAMGAIVVQGWLLGWLAYWRNSLRPGLLAHWLQDTLGNVVDFLFP